MKDEFKRKHKKNINHSILRNMVIKFKRKDDQSF